MTVRVRTSQVMKEPVCPADDAGTSSSAVASGLLRSVPEEPPSHSIFTNLVEAAKSAQTDEDLFLVMANETRLVAGAQQIFVFRHDPATQVAAISGMPRVNRQSPLVQFEGTH